jgi:putative hydrolase of the HAD superfamily
MARGILFDLDDTLIDRATSISQYAARFHSEFIAHIRIPLEPFVAEFMRLDGNGYVPRTTFFDGLSRYLSTPHIRPEDIAAHFVENAWSEPTLMLGAKAGLRGLRRNGAPIGIITNGGSVNQRQKMVNTGLDQLVDHVAISDEFGSRKPEPAIFHSTCEALRLEPSASWFVGDNPTADIVGAAAVGLRTVWLRRFIEWPKDQPECYTIAVSTLQEAFDTILNDV